MGHLFSTFGAHMKAHHNALLALKGTGSGVVTTQSIKNGVQLISSSVVNGTITPTDLKSHLAANQAAASQLPAASGGSTAASVTTSTTSTSGSGTATTTTTATPTSAPDTPPSTTITTGTSTGTSTVSGST
jgi:hypothetical protein